MSGRIALAGNVAAPKLKGEISVDRADISIPSGSARAFRSCRWRRSAAGATAAASDAASAPAQFALGLDLTVAMANQVFVRGRGLDSEWQGRCASRARRSSRARPEPST